MLTLDKATAGQELGPAELTLSHEAVTRYLEAVEAPSALLLEAPEVAPPTALAAASFRLLIEAVSLPAGTMHLAQEFRFLAPAAIGVRLVARARVAQKLRRGAATAIALEHSVLADEGGVCLSGRALLLVPSERVNLFPPPPAEGQGEGDGGVLGGGAGSRPGAPGGHDETAPVTPPRGPPDGLAPVVREITTDKISRYARATGDFNPIHLDEAFALGTPFGGIVAHGMMLLAYIAEVMEGAFGRGWRRGGGMDVRLRAPARPGDVVESRGSLQETRAAEAGMVAHCRVACVNQRGETLIAGRAWARLG